eukprot:UN30780
MDKAAFTWVCQLVDPELKLDNINLFFDFMKGDGIGGFDQWHAENFFSQEWSGAIDEFRNNVIAFMANNTKERTRKQLAKLYGDNEDDPQSAINTKRYPGNVEMAERDWLGRQGEPSDVVSWNEDERQHGELSPFSERELGKFTQQQQDNENKMVDGVGMKSIAPSIANDPYLRHLASEKSLNGDVDDDASRRLSVESGLTDWTDSTINTIAKPPMANDDFKQNLLKFNNNEQNQMSRLYNDINNNTPNDNPSSVNSGVNRKPGPPPSPPGPPQGLPKAPRKSSGKNR